MAEYTIPIKDLFNYKIGSFKYVELERLISMHKLTMRGDLPNFITNDIPAYLKANGVDMSPKYVRYIKYLKCIIINKTQRIIMNMK